MNPTPPGAVVSPDQTGPLPGVHRISHAAMATVFEVRCVHPDAAYARQAAQAAFALLDRLEQELSRFIPNSDVSRINDLRAGEGTRVSPSTFECLEIARHLLDLTGGAFDVSIGTGLDRLDLVPDDFVVSARADGIRLDLGGIGKGYAVDHMAELLEEWEVRHALVHGGFSSVRALDAPPDRDGWPLTLSEPGPGDPRVLARLEARHLALSASGTRKGDHIVEPGTGRAAGGRAVWVALSSATSPREGPTAPSVELNPSRPAALAEGLSTAFMLLPTGQIEGLCRRSPGLETWIAQAQGDESPAAFLHLPPSDEG